MKDTFFVSPTPQAPSRTSSTEDNVDDIDLVEEETRLLNQLAAVRKKRVCYGPMAPTIALNGLIIPDHVAPMGV